MITIRLHNGDCMKALENIKKNQYELDKDYFKAGVERVQKFIGQQDMFREEIELIVT